MGFEAADFKPFIRLVSAVIGLALLVLSCAGFHHLTRTRGAFEGQASFGCMCFLGVVFGILLFFGESKLELFFFFFGFMRYRIGRAVVFAIAGIMIAIIGKNMNDGCRCQTYILLIIEGVACLGCAALQLIGVFVFENNTSLGSRPIQPPIPPPSTEASSSSNTYVPPTPSTKSEPKKTPRSEPKTNFEPVVPAPTQSDEHNSNLPAWMRA